MRIYSYIEVFLYRGNNTQPLPGFSVSLLREGVYRGSIALGNILTEGYYFLPPHGGATFLKQ